MTNIRPVLARVVAQDNIGGVQNGTTYGYGETGFSIAPWTSLEPADKNGIVKMRVTDYPGGVE